MVDARGRSQRLEGGALISDGASFRRFGQPARFAVDVRLLPDPDGDDAVPSESVGSWAQWRLWVGGLNLAEHRLEQATGGVARQEWVTWYVAPLLRWLARVWTPLLHEQRLPGLVRRAGDARMAYLSVAATRMDDAAVFGPWQDWAGRHSLRAAAEGGLYPDIFLRRVGDDIEVSWGDRIQPGGDAVEYAIEPGVAHADVADVAHTLESFLTAMAENQLLKAHPWHKMFRRLVAAKFRVSALRTSLAWYLDGSARPGRLVKLLERQLEAFGAPAPRLGSRENSARAITRLSPEVAMFGAVSPHIGSQAATKLLALAIKSRRDEAEEYLLDNYVSLSSPAWRSPEAWDDGYRLALDFLDQIGMADEGPIDLEKLLCDWRVLQVSDGLGDEGPLGVALAGNNYQPTIIMNLDHPQNQHHFGRRFTLAHELCHLLYDRDRSRAIGHSSTPWAPVAVEQRANAFAAMLLMSPASVRANFHPGRQVKLNAVKALADKLRVGLRATIRHLGNIGELTPDICDRLLLEAEHRGAQSSQVSRVPADY